MTLVVVSDDSDDCFLDDRCDYPLSASFDLLLSPSPEISFRAVNPTFPLAVFSALPPPCHILSFPFRLILFLDFLNLRKVFQDMKSAVITVRVRIATLEKITASRSWLT